MKHFVAVFFIIGRVIAADDKKGRLKGNDGRIIKFDWQVRPWKSVKIVLSFPFDFQCGNCLSQILRTPVDWGENKNL